MSDIKTLAALVGELEDRLITCMRCGMCQAVCPLYAETGRESDVARGKLALLDGLSGELFKDARGVSERLERCLLCGSCGANCPSGVSTMEIFLKARAILTGVMGLSPAKRIVLRGMLAHPGLLDRLVALGAGLQKTVSRPAGGASCARFRTPLMSARHFVPLAPAPFHSRLPIQHLKKAETRHSPGIRAAFFIGCLIDKFFPGVAEAAIKAMDSHEIHLQVPMHQGCCGIPALSAGDLKTFSRLVRYHLELFPVENFDYLVTACATCTSTIRKLWPMMGAAWPEAVKRRVSELAEKTVDITVFLDRMIGPAKESAQPDRPVVATYHDPCHLKKSLGISNEPRRLIRANPDYQLVEMEAPDACCGMGGSFNLKYYEMSAAIGARKGRYILDSGASVVATACPACMMQISDMLSRTGNSITVRHAIEIYAENLERAST